MCNYMSIDQQSQSEIVPITNCPNRKSYQSKIVLITKIVPPTQIVPTANRPHHKSSQSQTS